MKMNEPKPLAQYLIEKYGRLDVNWKIHRVVCPVCLHWTLLIESPDVKCTCDNCKKRIHYINNEIVEAMLKGLKKK